MIAYAQLTRAICKFLMTVVHVLTNGFNSPNAFAFLMPLIIHSNWLSDLGIKVKLFREDTGKSLDDCDVLIFESKFLDVINEKTDGERLAYFQALRARNDNLIYADIQDSSGWDSAPMLPAVKLYAKAHLLKDRQQYLKPVYSFRIYCEFFNNEFGIEDDGAYSVPISNPNDLGKLCLLWNSALADYRFFGLYRMLLYNKAPLEMLLDFPSPKAFTNVMQDRPVDVTCRVGTSYSRETIAFHRKMITHKLQGYIQKDRLKRAQYLEELRQNKVSISPFGFGETCYRDFESILAGALLFKPNMNHLETWPPIYTPGQTYIPFSWKADDLVDLVEKYIAEDTTRREIAANAQNTYQNFLSNPDSGSIFARHFFDLIKKCLG